MADETVVHIGENSPEKVAYTLTRDVLFSVENSDWNNLDRKTFLDTYAECLHAVRGFRDFR